MSFIWNDTNTEALRQLWLAGKSASECAAEIGAPSRSAVLGKVHRLGFARSEDEMRKAFARAAENRERQRQHVVRYRERKPKWKELAVEPLPPVQEQIENAVSVLDVTGCRYPVTPHDAPEILFCNAPQAPERSYCAAHCRVAYRPPADKRRTA